MSAFGRMLLLGAAMTAPTSAHGFGLRTHLYIAEQVLNELKNRNCEILTAGSTTKVPEAVCQAILKHPGAFRAGAIGPDAFPDLVVGQTFVHPGTKNGRQAADWLDQLLSEAKEPDEVAFAYGEMVHAAGDVFAHSYVNNYAGAIFDLTSRRHKDVEKRHFELEKYIEQRLDFEASLDTLEVPSGLLIRTMVKTSYVPANINLTHELLMQAFTQPGKVALKEITQKLEKAAPAGHLTAMWGILAFASRSFDQPVCNDIAAVAEQIRTYRNYLQAETDARAGKAPTVSPIAKIVTPQGEASACSSDKLVAAEAEWAKLLKERHLLSWNDQALNERGTWWKELPPKVRRPLMLAHEEHLRAVEVRKKVLAVRLMAPIWAKDVEAAIAAYMQASLKAAKVMVRNGEPLPPSLAERRSAKAPYERWMECYRGVFQGTIPSEAARLACERTDAFGGDMSARDAVLLAGGSKISTGGVLTYLNFKEWIDAKIFDALVVAAKLYSPDLGKLIEEIHTPVRIGRDHLNATFSRARSGQLAFRCVADLIDADLGMLPKGEGVIANDEGCKLRSAPSRFFDPSKFVPITYSVTLAKLALLDRSGIQQLATAIAERTPGKAVVLQTGRARRKPGDLGSPPHYSVILDTVRSLDGSHQWQGYSMPFPSSTPLDSAMRLDGAGYPSSEKSGITITLDRQIEERQGFPYYQTDDLRRRVFSILFPGPFEGEILRRREFLPDYYPFHSCSNDPFRSVLGGQGAQSVCLTRD